jgi:hypothetical protein
MKCRDVGGGRVELAFIVYAIAANGEMNAQGLRFVELASGGDVEMGGLSV